MCCCAFLLKFWECVDRAYVRWEIVESVWGHIKWGWRKERSVRYRELKRSSLSECMGCARFGERSVQKVLGGGGGGSFMRKLKAQEGSLVLSGTDTFTWYVFRDIYCGQLDILLKLVFAPFMCALGGEISVFLSWSMLYINLHLHTMCFFACAVLSAGSLESDRFHPTPVSEAINCKTVATAVCWHDSSSKASAGTGCRSCSQVLPKLLSSWPHACDALSDFACRDSHQWQCTYHDDNNLTECAFTHIPTCPEACTHSGIGACTGMRMPIHVHARINTPPPPPPPHTHTHRHTYRLTDTFLQHWCICTGSQCMHTTYIDKHMFWPTIVQRSNINTINFWMLVVATRSVWTNSSQAQVDSTTGQIP